MSETDNGNPSPVEIDVTNEIAFRTGVIQYFQLLTDRTADLPALKRKVERHDRAYQYAKWMLIPLLAAIEGALHGAFQHVMTKIHVLGGR